MEMITKGIAKTLEFGDDGNFGTLIPEAIYLRTINGDTIHAVVTWNYGKNDGRTIDLCHNELHEIDFESFSTTLEVELDKIGYKMNEVQRLKNKWYIIKDANGNIVPFEKFEVRFDYVQPGQFGWTEEKIIECETQGEENALKYAERCVLYPSWMKNIDVIKVGNINE